MQRGCVTVCLVKQLVGVAVCPERRLCLVVGSWDLLTCCALPPLGVEEVFAAHLRAAGGVATPETRQGRILSWFQSPSFLSLQLAFFGVVPSSSSGEGASRRKRA